MAYCNKFSSLIRQSILKSNVETPCASVLHLLVPNRSVSSTRLFLGSKPHDFPLEPMINSSRRLSASFGSVTDGRSRGFGFLDFENDEDANTAKSAMDGQELNGRSIQITCATDDRRPARFDGGYDNQGNGGYRGGSRGACELDDYDLGACRAVS